MRRVPFLLKSVVLSHCTDYRSLIILVKKYLRKKKTLDTLDHKAKRKMWVKEWYTLLTDKFANVAILDEKWFYTTNRRRKIKRLPLGGNEKEGDDKVKHPQMRSSRFPIKSMFMGVVGRPRPDKFFDGGILLERVSKKHIIKKKNSISML